ncbi:MAG TPA: beta-1,3-glucanase family protein, partial [Trebonia sp.]
MWSYYSSHPLTVSTGSATYTGTVSGSSWVFKDSSGNMIGSLGQPSTSNVLGCNGPLQPPGQPNESAILAVGAIVCAALNRATLSTSSFRGSDSQPTSNSAAFYTQSSSNQYAKVMHANEVDGKAYGFPYDDVAGFSPSIDDATASSASVTVAPFQGSSSYPSGYQQLRVGSDSLCLDVSGASTANNAPIDQWGCKTSAQSNQEFQFNPVSGGYGELQNQNSGLDINVSGASTANLAPVIQWTQDGAPNALWLPAQLSDGSWQFKNQNSGLCLDVSGNSSTAGTQLEQYTCKSNAAGTNQGFTTTALSGGTGAPPTGGSLSTLGASVHVFSPGEAQSTIQADINTLYNAQVTNQFGSQRYTLLFEPGTYGSASDPLTVNVGYYEEVAGLGQSPAGTVINGVVNSYNQCNGTNCLATDNFWRSVYNLTINVNSGGAIDGCHNNNDDFWATSQDAPIRRVQVNGTLTLMDFCDSPGYASGGFIGDSGFSSAVQNDSQQQFLVQNSNLSGWSNAVWNQVFCGDNGAPAQSFAANSGDSGGPSSYTTLSACGPTEQEPYLYQDSSGNLNVFVPSAQTGQAGPSWASGSTPGSPLSLNSFYVASPSSSAETINAALAAGDSILFTPGYYTLDESLNVTAANTKLIGLGFATLEPTKGTAAITVADVAGVNLSGLIVDAGPVNSPVLVQLGVAGSTASNSSNPVTVDDLNVRIGGEVAGAATTAVVDDSNNSILDNVWLWRADHGAGQTGTPDQTGVGGGANGCWTCDVSQTGLQVNASNVSAYGLAVEHFEAD